MVLGIESTNLNETLNFPSLKSFRLKYLVGDILFPANIRLHPNISQIGFLNYIFFNPYFLKYFSNLYKKKNIILIK